MDFNCPVLQVNLIMPSSATLPLVERFNASASLVSCILPDEPVLKKSEVSSDGSVHCFSVQSHNSIVSSWVILLLLVHTLLIFFGFDEVELLHKKVCTYVIIE